MTATLTAPPPGVRTTPPRPPWNGCGEAAKPRGCGDHYRRINDSELAPFTDYGHGKWFHQLWNRYLEKAIKLRLLTRAEASTARRVADYGESTGECCPSQATIGEAEKRAARTINGHLAAVFAAGFLDRSHITTFRKTDGTWEHHPCHYVMRLPQWAQDDLALKRAAQADKRAAERDRQRAANPVPAITKYKRTADNRIAPTPPRRNVELDSARSFATALWMTTPAGPSRYDIVLTAIDTELAHKGPETVNVAVAELDELARAHARRAPP